MTDLKREFGRQFGWEDNLLNWIIKKLSMWVHVPQDKVEW
jgi:hypothetical protein